MAIDTIFFDLGDTLGRPRINPDTGEIRSIDVLEGIPDTLRRLQDGGLRLGIISNTGDIESERIIGLLEASGLLTFFSRDLLIFSHDVGVTKASPAIFAVAAQRAGRPAGRCMYVGENDVERDHAAAVGMATCPLPRLVWDKLHGTE